MLSGLYIIVQVSRHVKPGKRIKNKKNKKSNSPLKDVTTSWFSPGSWGSILNHRGNHASSLHDAALLQQPAVEKREWEERGEKVTAGGEEGPKLRSHQTLTHSRPPSTPTVIWDDIMPECRGLPRQPKRVRLWVRRMDFSFCFLLDLTDFGSKATPALSKETAGLSRQPETHVYGFPLYFLNSTAAKMYFPHNRFLLFLLFGHDKDNLGEYKHRFSDGDFIC